MNVSVPGGCQIPPPSPSQHRNNLIEALKAIFKSAWLVTKDVRTIWQVIEYMKNPKSKKLAKEVADDLKEIADNRGLESQHARTLYDVANEVNKLNKED
jgi:hypothetical protein